MRTKEVKPFVFYADYDVNRFSLEDLEELGRLAMINPAGKALLCLHRSAEKDRLHEMVYAYKRGVSYPLHKHLKSDESKFVLLGKAVLGLYDDDGSLVESVSMTALGQGGVSFVRVPAGIYHSFDIESDVCVYSEAKLGPFDPDDNVFASFAPAGGTEK